MRRALILLLVAAAGCVSDDADDDAAPTSTTAIVSTSSSSTTSTTEPPTTTTLPPPTPRATPTEAVDYLLGAWQAGDRPGALTVAEPDAVDALFAIPAEQPEARGCNEPPPGFGAPTYCVYRLVAGELQVRAAEVEGGFVVDQVVLSAH